MAAAPACWLLEQCAGPVIDGEEWRNDIYTSPDTTHRTPHNEVIAESRSAIEKHRKENILIRFTNADGKPLSGVKTTVLQTTSRFDWGCSESGNDVHRSEEANHRRTKHLAELFNCTTAKCYWDERWHQPIEHVEGKRITTVFEEEVQWGKANRLRVKGHPLVWTVRKALPQWLDKYDYTTQLKKLEQHVRQMIAIGGTDVTRWDLCNEMLWEPSLRHYQQRRWPHIEHTDEILTYLEPAMHWAREANRHAIYSLNDYGLEKTYRPEITAEDQRKRYVELVEKMKLRGCAPDAIGTQAHVAGWYTPAVFRHSLNDLATAGLPLQITEFWAHTNKQNQLEKLNSQQKQLAVIAYITDMYTIAFGHPAVQHFTYWGDEQFVDTEGNKTAVYDALYLLIRQQWMTNEQITTDASGTLSLRGFHGDYQIQYLNSRNKIITTNFVLEPDHPVEIKIHI